MKKKKNLNTMQMFKVCVSNIEDGSRLGRSHTMEMLGISTLDIEEGDKSVFVF